MKANLTGFGLQRRSPPFLALSSTRAVARLLCEGGFFPSQHPHAAQTSDRRAGVVETTCSASRRQPPNPRKAAGALSRWSSRSVLHLVETRLRTSLQFHISFIVNSLRKRPEIKQGKNKTQSGSVHIPKQEKQTPHLVSTSQNRNANA